MNALAFIQRSNPNAFLLEEGGVVYAIEDVGSPGKLYRIEYRTTPDGAKAIAFIHRTPAPVPSTMRHLSQAQQLDCGDGWPSLDDSTTALGEAIFRARFWCTSHTHYVTNQHLIEETQHVEA